MAAFPNVGINSMTMRLTSAVSMSRSPFTFNQQVYQHQGVQWEAEVSLPPLNRAEAKQVEAFFAGLRGMSTTFTMGNPLHDIVAVGSIDSAAAGAVQVTVSGFSGAVAGDYFELNGSLHIITEVVNSTTLKIMPPIRSAISSAVSMDFSLPQGTWRLASNSIDWSINQASIYGFTFACVEAL